MRTQLPPQTSKNQPKPRYVANVMVSNESRCRFLGDIRLKEAKSPNGEIDKDLWKRLLPYSSKGILIKQGVFRILPVDESQPAPQKLKVMRPPKLVRSEAGVVDSNVYLVDVTYLRSVPCSYSVCSPRTKNVVESVYMSPLQKFLSAHPELPSKRVRKLWNSGSGSSRERIRFVLRELEENYEKEVYPSSKKFTNLSQAHTETLCTKVLPFAERKNGLVYRRVCESVGINVVHPDQVPNLSYIRGALRNPVACKRIVDHLVRKKELGGLLGRELKLLSKFPKLCNDVIAQANGKVIPEGLPTLVWELLIAPYLEMNGVAVFMCSYIVGMFLQLSALIYYPGKSWFYILFKTGYLAVILSMFPVYWMGCALGYWLVSGENFFTEEWAGRLWLEHVILPIVSRVYAIRQCVLYWGSVGVYRWRQINGSIVPMKHESGNLFIIKENPLGVVHQAVHVGGQVLGEFLYSTVFEEQRNVLRSGFMDIKLQDWINVAQIYVANTLQQKTLAVMSFISSYTFTFLYRSVSKKVRQLVKFLFHGFSIPGEETAIQEYLPEGLSMEFIQQIQASPLFTKTIGALILFGSNDLFNENEALNLVKSTMTWMAHNVKDTMEFATVITNLSAYWRERLTAAIASKNVMDLFEPDPATLALDKLEKARDSLQEVRKNGKNFAETVAAVRSLLEKTSKNTNRHICSQWELAYNELLATVQDARFKRELPLGIIITGPPGTGKTTLVSNHARVIKARSGLEESVEVVFYAQNTTHQVVPALGRIYLMNDTFQSKDEVFAVAQGSSLIEKIQQICDTAPLRENGASLTDKAFSNVYSDFCYFTTNAERYTASTLTSGANKLDRRVLVLDVAFTPEYCQRYQDPAKAFSRRFDSQARIFRLGYMKNEAKGTTIDFTIKDLIFETKNENEVIIFIEKELEARRAKRVVEYDYVCTKCKLPPGSSSCFCNLSDFNAAYRDAMLRTGFTGNDLVEPEVECESEVTMEGLFDWKVEHKPSPELEELFRKATTNTYKVNVGVDEEVKTLLEKVEQALKKVEVRVSASIFPEGVYTFFERIMTPIKNVLKDIPEVDGKKLLAFGAMVGTASIAISMYRTMMKLSPQGNIIQSLTNVEKKEDVVVNPFFDKITPWCGIAHQPVLARIKASGCEMYVVFITHQIFVTCAHVFKGTVKGDVCSISHSGNRDGKFSYDPRFASFNEAEDVVYYFIPGFPAVIDIAYSKLPHTRLKGTMSVAILNQTVVARTGTHGPVYDAVTKDGDCGAPIVTVDGAFVGIHKGRYESGLKVGAYVSLADFNLAKREIESRGIDIPMFSDSMPPIIEVYEKEGMLKPGVSPNSDAGKFEKFEDRLEFHDALPLYHLPFADQMKGTISETNLRSAFPECPEYSLPHLGKAVCVEGVWKSPCLKRLRFMGKGGVFPHDHIMNAIEGMLNDISVFPLSTPLDLYRTVCGDVSNACMNPRDNRKSIGLSPKKVLGLTNATAFKEVREGVFEMSPKLKGAYEENMRHLYSDEPLRLGVVKACDKIELKKAKGVKEEASGRLYYLSDLDSNLSAKSLLQPLIVLHMTRPYETGCVITLNAASNAWGELYDYMNAFGGENVWDGDHVGYDLRHSGMMYYYAVYMKELSRRCGYTPEDQRALFRAIMQSTRRLMFLCGNIFLSTTGWDSGRPDTIVLNSVVQKMIEYATLSMRGILVAGKIFGSIPRTYVHVIVTGDDNMTSSHPLVNLTGSQVQEVATLFGYELTRADKVPGPITPVRLTEVQYLKRSFRVEIIDNRRYVFAPLDEGSRLRSICYRVDCKKGDEDARDKAAIQSAYLEAFLLGRKYYDDFVRRIREVVDVPSEDYDELLTRYNLGRLLVWEPGTRPMGRNSLEIESESPAGGAIVFEGLICKPLKGSTALQSFSQLSASKLNDNEIVHDELDPSSVVHVNMLEEEKESYRGGLFGLRKKSEEVSLEHFFSRPRLVDTYSSDTGGQFTAFSKWKSIPAVSSFLSKWGLFRGDARIRVSVTGGTQYMGLLRMYAYPNRSIHGPYETSVVTPPITFLNTPLSYTLTSQLPHIDIDLSATSTYELDLPFPLPREYLSISTEFDWTVYIGVINPAKLATGATPDTLPLQIYISYVNVTLDRVIPEGLEAEGGALSRLLEYASVISSAMPFAWSSPVGALFGAGSKVAKYFGFSKPPVESFANNMVRFSMNPALMSGQPDFSMTFASDPGALRNVERVVPLDSDSDSSLSAIMSKSVMIEADWVLNEPLAIIPGLAWRGTGPAGPMFTTPLSFVASMFEYWTGDINVCIQAITSPMTRWRIGIVIVPPGIVAPLAFPTTNTGQFITYVMEIAGTTCMDIVIPYLYTDPFQKFKFFPNDDSIPHLPETRIVAYSLVNPTGPSPTPVYPYLNVWIKAGENFSVGVPDLSVLDEWKIIPEGLIGNGLQSAATFGEVFSTVEQMAKRSVAFWEFFPKNETHNGYFSIPVQPGAPTDADLIMFSNGSQKWSFVSWLSQAYFGVTGSYSYKLEPQDTNVQTIVTMGNDFGRIGPIPTPQVGRQRYLPTSRGAQSWVTRNTPYFEVRCPDRNPLAFRIGSTYLQNSIDVYAEGLWLINNVETDINYRVWVAAGDDFKFHGFLNSPVLYARA